jgi:diphosphomevalonate decarboxylase
MNTSFHCPPVAELPTGEQRWQAPSNIALVKYWGKYGMQLPKNPSLSFTLQTSLTTTTVAYQPAKKKAKGVSFEFLFEGLARPEFHPKLDTFFDRILPYQPFLEDLSLSISSTNSFPHSSGIASSAAAYAALSAALVAIEESLFPGKEHLYWDQKRSFLARLGSGSAARSLQGPMMLWGEHAAFDGSSNDYAIPFEDGLNPIFQDYQDCILLVDKGQKKVSSTLGHVLMEGHPYAVARFEQAHRHTQELANALQSGDLEAFIRITESEALTLHAMMQTSQPYFILMRPNTLHIIEALWAYRQDTQIPLCFTLDAGANVHLLYPKQYADKILSFVKDQLLTYCQAGEYLLDSVGQGAKKL